MCGNYESSLVVDDGCSMRIFGSCVLGLVVWVDWDERYFLDIEEA